MNATKLSRKVASVRGFVCDSLYLILYHNYTTKYKIGQESREVSPLENKAKNDIIYAS